MNSKLLNYTKHIIFKDLRLLAISVVLLVFYSSCKHDDLDVYVPSDHYSSASDFAANNYDLQLFHAALEYAGLLDTLRGPGPFTIFAPNNQAFNNLGIVRAADFQRMNKDSLRFMMKYHVLPRLLYKENVPDQTTDNLYKNLAGENLHVGFKKSTNYLPDDLVVNGVSSTVHNSILGNGVLHVIDQNLKFHKTIQETLEKSPVHSLFIRMLKHFKLWDLLATKGPFTVFAPTDEAFKEINLKAEDIDAMEPSAYDIPFLLRPYILRNHVFTTDFGFYGELTGSPYGETYLFMPVEGAEEYVSGVRLSFEGGNIGSAAFVSEKKEYEGSFGRNAAYAENWQRNSKSSNGVVHFIRQILVYPEEALKNKKK